MFVYRDAEWRDLDWILACRNDPVTRCNSLQSMEISREEHENWFRRSLSMHDRRLLIVEKEFEKIGILRFDQVDEQKIEVSINLIPEARNRGYGETILEKAATLAVNCWPQTSTLLAKIKKNNIPSIKCFTKAGFRKMGEEHHIIWMILPISK